jgi:MHS family shikimate/dehydroshikimate transporter-like MFS transporter
MLLIIGARAAENTWFYLVVAFALAYAANQLKIPKTEILHAITAGAALSLVTMPLAGYVSDWIGQKRLFIIGLVVMCLFASPFFTMLETRDSSTVWWAMVLAVGVVFPILYAPESQLYACQFPAEVRYSGISVSVQVAGVLGGGIAPMIATALLVSGVGNPQYVVDYMLVLGVIAIVCAFFMRVGAHSGDGNSR